MEDGFNELGVKKVRIGQCTSGHTWEIEGEDPAVCPMLIGRESPNPVEGILAVCHGQIFCSDREIINERYLYYPAFRMHAQVEADVGMAARKRMMQG